MGLPNFCPRCVEEPAPGVAPAEWSAYLVDTEIHQATVTIGMRPWTLQPNDLLVQDVAPLQCAPQVPKREPKDFLCMYVFAGTTVGAMENLGYFLTFGIDPNRCVLLGYRRAKAFMSLKIACIRLPCHWQREHRLRYHHNRYSKSHFEAARQPSSAPCGRGRVE
jgi:hypothetical protein